MSNHETCVKVTVDQAGTIADLRTALARADRLIGWMADHIGGMAPPDGGIADLNEHWLFMEKNGGASPPPESRGGRPLNQPLPR